MSSRSRNAPAPVSDGINFRTEFYLAIPWSISSVSSYLGNVIRWPARSRRAKRLSEAAHHGYPPLHRVKSRESFASSTPYALA